MQKVLITGSTGYIGNYTSRILAATRPNVTVYALSRQTPDVNREKYPAMSRFENIKFIQGDCLDEDSLPIVLNDCDVVIHMVGAILDSFNYKKVLQNLKFNQEVKSPQECILGKIKEM